MLVDRTNDALHIYGAIKVQAETYIDDTREIESRKLFDGLDRSGKREDEEVEMKKATVNEKSI